MKVLLTATALILSMTAATDAADAPRASDVLGAGPIYAESANALYCEYVNFGTTNITPTSQQLFQNGSTVAIDSSSSCANDIAVAPNQGCYIYPTGSVGGLMACKVTFNAAATSVRGSLQLYYNGTTQSTVELR